MRRKLLKLTTTLYAAGLLLTGVIPVGCAFGEDGSAGNEESAKAASPYFLVPDGTPLGDFPLVSNDADVRIAGPLVDVRLTQTYKNKLSQPLEATYVFPVATGAAVHSLKLQIGERTIEAQIQEKEMARNQYDAAKNAGKTAALLEQHRPNVLQTHVANILPGETVIVTADYSEILKPREGTYQFVAPMVVGPRYVSGVGESIKEDAAWTANPYLISSAVQDESAADGSPAFSVHASVVSGIPLKELRSPSHPVRIQYQSDRAADITFDPADRQAGRRDFVLDYRLAGDAIEQGMILYRGGDENFFALTVEPPVAPRAEQIPPRDFVFVLDVSGSMAGFPLDTAKTLMKRLLSGLKPTDTFNIELFSGGSSVLSPTPLPADPASIRMAVNFLERTQAAGGTELLPALRQALTLGNSRDVARAVVVITDGYITAERQTYDLIRQERKAANVYAFGVGTSVNRYLMEGIAAAGGGEPFFVMSQSEANEQSARFISYVSTPVLAHPVISFEGFETYDVTPVTIPDVLAKRPIVVTGKWKGSARGTAILSGLGAEGLVSQRIPVETAQLTDNAALRSVWARMKVAELADYASAPELNVNKREVTSLGLKYALLTPFTSFIAVDDQVRAHTPSMTVAQPLPLPMGVPASAVGSYTGSGGGANSGVQTFSEANFDDTLIRNSVGNTFRLVEGGLGFAAMLLSGTIGAVLLAIGWRSARRRSWWFGVTFSTFAVLAFGVRCLVMLFFGRDYE